MNETINKVLKHMGNETDKSFRPRIPEQNEEPEQTKELDTFYEMDFYAAEGFKLGFLLGMEVFKKP